MIQKILKSTNLKLREVSKEVLTVDKKTLAVIQDLKDTLNAQKQPEGVGLAAPQIGKNVRIFIAKYKNFSRVVINPKVIDIDKQLSKKKNERTEILEGCLSLTGYYGPLRRSKSVTIEYLDESGKKITEKFTDFDAQVILHEIDHLNGILFIDRIIEQKERLYKLTNGHWEDVELV